MNIGEIKSFKCVSNARGQTMKITILGRKEFLTLCEVIVYGKGMY